MSSNDTAGTGSPTSENPWASYITPFAAAIGRTPEEVTVALRPLVGDPGDEAIELLRSDADTPFDSIRECLQGVATAKLRRAITTHLRAPTPAAAPAAQPTVLATAFNVLPEVPNDDSWLKMLQTGGVLKVGKQTVIAAVRAGLGSRTNLFNLPDTLVRLMESTAESLDEPVSEEFFNLRKLLTRRRYSDIFQALEGEAGVDGRFITQNRKDKFVDRLDTELWPSLLEFQSQVKGWVEGWQTQMANPAMMMTAIASAVGGGGGLPPGMMAPPPTDGLRDGASGVIDRINRVFAGVGAPIAAAMAYEAMKIREVLENPALPVLVGAQNREQMLKKCGAAVTADYVRLERGLTQYVLAVMDLPEVQASQELAYISALYQLGVQIPWSNLQAPARRSNLPRTSSARSSVDDE